MFRFTVVAVLLSCVVLGLVVVMAGTPQDKNLPTIPLRTMIVGTAQPSTLVKHTVEWKNGIDAIRHETLLTGPQMYSTEMDVKADATEAIRFSWYQLPPNFDEKPRTIRLTIKDNTELSLSVGAPAFFLSTTQRLQEGTPAEPPDGLSPFVAYRVLNGTEKSQTLELETAGGRESFTLKRLAFVCLPTQEWHHDEYFGVTDATSSWVVYEIEAIGKTSSVTTLDQFGFNQLTVGASEWLCVPSSIKSIK